MTYLLDTVVVSALRLPGRNPRPAEWLRIHQHDDLWISVLTIGEIAQGIELAPDAWLRRELEAWLDQLTVDFEPWIAPFGARESVRWGRLCAPLQLAGRPPALVDSMIAATAIERGLTIVSRNVRDFAPFGVPVINPWEDENGA